LQIRTSRGSQYKAIILAVAHIEFMSIDLKEQHKKAGTVIYDVKGIVNLALVDGRLCISQVKIHPLRLNCVISISILFD
jgi:UDP-N-acetyl-D-mannosaminuronate dehydrogenase